MMAKTFEIRDEGTFIPILAVRLEPGNERDRYLLARAGYGRHPWEQAAYVVLAEINGGWGEVNCDPYRWTRARTLRIAHEFIRERWNELESGDVVDVAFILGEREAPASSEEEGLPL